MRKLLTSQLTIFNKIVIPIIWGSIVIGTMIFIFIHSRDPKSFLVILMLLPLILTTRCQQITYDDENVYIYNWRKTRIYKLSEVKAINEGQWTTFDPYFQLEIVDRDGRNVKIDFMPKVNEQFTFELTKKYTGHLLDLKNKIIASKK